MWSNFELLSSEEEIIDNTFSINSVFHISSEEEVTQNPCVIGNFQNKRVVISIDKSLVLFDNENFSNCKFLNFESNIDCLIVSSHATIVICGLSDGNICGVHINGVVIFNLSIATDDVNHTFGGRTFVDVKEINDEYYLMCRNGRIYRITNVFGNELSDTIINGIDTDMNETLSNNIILDTITNTKHHFEIDAYSLCSFGADVTHLYSSNKFLYLKSSDLDMKIPLPKGCEAIKTVLDCRGIILALFENGQLFELCPFTGLLFPSANPDHDIIKNAIVMENNDSDIELLLLIESKMANVSNLFIKVVEFPTMKCKYTLPVPANTWIINQPKASANVYYLHGHGDAKKSKFIENIEMRAISQAQPDNRLNTLIQKGLLEDAETFARQFNLSPQPIYEAKAKRILFEIGEINKSDIKEVQEKLSQLLSIAKLITNTEFLLKFRNMEMPSRNIMKQFLEFLTQHVKFDDFPRELDEIKEQLLRLETLSMIDVDECDLQWRKFVHHENLIFYCFKFFETDISMACFILKQHAASIIPTLKDTNILKLLNTIPGNVEPFGVIQWLRHYVPMISKTYPQSLPILTDWVISKTTSFQYLKEWPEIGLEFSNNMLNIFANIDFLFPDTRLQYDMSLERIRRVISVLEELSVLKSRYNLGLTFDDYMNESVEQSAFRILQRININNLGNVVNNFLFAIFNEKGLSSMPTVIEYIRFLIRNRKNINVWQDRAVACTLLLHNEEQKLQCAVEILKVAPVPWSKSLDAILKLRFSSHPLAGEIVSEYQSQEIKKLRLKYGWKADDNLDTNSMRFIFRMVKVNPPDLILDIRTYVEFKPLIKGGAYFYCAHRLAATGYVEKSIQLIDSLGEEDARKCCNRILKITSVLTQDEIDSPDAFRDLIELMKHAAVKASGSYEKAVFDNLLRLQILRNDFGLKITMDEMTQTKNKEQFLKQGIDSILNQLRNCHQDFVQKAWNSILLLAKALNFDVVKIVLKLVQQINNVRFTSAMSKLTLEFVVVNGDNWRFFIDLAVLLMVQQCIALDGVNSDNYINPMSYPLAYRLLIQAQKSTDENIRELLNWSRIGNDAYSLDSIHSYLESSGGLDDNIVDIIIESMTERKPKVEKMNRRDSMSIFEQVKENNSMPVVEDMPDSVVKCLSLLLKIILKDLDGKTPFMSYFAEFTIPKEEAPRAELFSAINHLIKNKKSIAAFSIIQFIVGQQGRSKKIIVSNDAVSAFIKKIIKIGLHQKEPTYETLVPILNADPSPEDCLGQLEREFKSGIVKINFLTLQEKYGEFINDLNRTKLERECRLKYFYYMELCQIDPSLRTDTNFDIISYEQLFADLKTKIIDVKLLEKISKDFFWNFQKVLVHQIITILSTQELEFTTKIDALGKEELTVKTSAEKIYALCKPYINLISDTKYFAGKLFEFLETINSYFYELYLCVIDILTQIHALKTDMELWSQILLFLKHKMITKRSKRVSQIETDWWLRSQMDGGILPKIAKFRFPFRMLITEPLKNILDDEVNVENCRDWFPLIKLHMNMKGTYAITEICQEEDYFCMSAIKNSITDYKVNNDSSNEIWNLQPVNNAFLQAVMHLVRYMKDLQRILFVLYFVANQAPEGADQVEAAYECYKFAIEHGVKFREAPRANETVQKIKRKYPMYKIQHLLHLHNLHDDKLGQLIEHPAELISALYNHEVVLQPENKIDVNQIAQEVAELHQLDFHLLQIGLLQKWLSFSVNDSSGNLDETFYSDLNVTVSNIETEICNDSVERAYYILKSWEPNLSSDFLISHIFSSDNEGTLNTRRQLQIFDCLIKLVNEDTNKGFLELISTPQYIALKCVHYLKSFGFKFSIERFQQYDKLKILKQIWVGHVNNPKAMDLISYICIGYDIYEPIIWNNLLKQMVQLHMKKELLALLDCISMKHSLVHLDGLAIAWEYLIRAPFKNINKTRSYDQDVEMCKALFMLQSCPLKSKMNLVEMAEMCVRLQQVHIGAIFIAFGRDEQKQKIRELLEPHKSATLRKDIIYLEEFGIYPFVTKLAIRELKL